MKPRWPLWLPIFLISLMAVLLTMGGAWLWKSRQAALSGGDNTAELLAGHLSVQTAFQQQRQQHLRMMARVFATDPVLTSYLVEATQIGDPFKVLDLVEEYQNLLAFDLAVVLDRNGRTLLRTNDPETRGEDLSGDPLIRVALEENQASGFWVSGERLYQALAVPLVRSFDLVGYLVVGYAINDAFSLQIKRGDETDTAFVARSDESYSLVASTLEPAAASALVPALRRQSEVSNRVLEEGQTVGRFDLELDGRLWATLLAPLRDAEGKPAGALVSLRSRAQQKEALRRFELLQLIAAGIALLASLLMSLWLAQRALEPLRQISGAIREASGGSRELPGAAKSRNAVVELGQSAEALLGDLAEKQALERHVTEVSKLLPEPSKDAVRRPEARPLVLLAVEMRRFANPKLGYDPEQGLDRMSRDLRRLAAAAAARQGRLESVFGHRALVTFEGDGAAFRGLSAATEALLVLSQSENVFDEPEPPVIVLTLGTAVSGSVSWGDRRAEAVLGLPIQQLESLLREAVPGDLLLSAVMHKELADVFAEVGVEVQARRGVVSPQPLYPVSSEVARRLTGVTPPDPGEETLAAARGLSDLGPGVVLGNRFELLAALGSGRVGMVFKARDRDQHTFLTLKVLKPAIVNDAFQIDRLKSRILQARNIVHPNVIGLFDFGEVDGLPYVAMEYVRGVHLRYHLEQGRRLPVAAGLHVMRCLCAGLKAGHGARVLHLGIKPENVLIEPTGNPRLMDFGLSLLDEANGGAGASPYYLAPEQLGGQSADPRTDLYALGVVFYEMLTGQPPFSGGSPNEIRRQHLEAQPVSPTAVAGDIPSELDELILRCLAKSPDDRFASAEELAAALDGIRL